MKSLQTRVLVSLVALLFIVAATASFAPVVDAQRGGGSRMGGSSFRSSSSWSSGPSKSVWGSRSGGGIYTKPSGFISQTIRRLWQAFTSAGNVLTLLEAFFGRRRTPAGVLQAICRCWKAVLRQLHQT